MKKIHNSKYPIYLLITALLTWSVFLMLVWQEQGFSLNWDEVDYVNATRLGVWANYIEKGSLSAQEYIEFSLSKLEKSQNNEYSLPPNYSEEKDPFLLRHYHPPFVNYLLSVINITVGTNSERLARSVQLFGALVFILLVFGCYYRMTGGEVNIASLVVISCLSIWMSSYLFNTIHYHGWISVWFVLICWFLTNWLNEDRSGIPLIASLALAVLTLETGLFIVFYTLIIVLAFAYLKIKTISWKQIIFAFILLSGLIMLGWGGAFLKISLLKIFGQHLYRFMLGQEYSGATERLFGGFILLMPVFLMSIIALVFLIKENAKQTKKWIVFFVMGWLYALVMFPLSISQTYFLPAVGPLMIFIAGTLSIISSKWVRLPIAFLAVILFLSTVVTKSRIDSSQDIQFRNDLDWVRDKLKDRESFVDGGHIFRFYLDDNQLIKPLTVGYTGKDKFAIRENGKYVLIEDDRAQGKIFIILKKRQDFEQNKEQLVPSNCRLYERPTIWFYDCGN
jgi:hypothetical protein